MRTLLAIAVLVGCTSPTPDPGITCGTGTMLVDGQCIAMLTTCGAGTHESNGTCSPTPPSATIIRALPTIPADGSPVRVFVVGPVGEQIVLNTDRPNAGTFDPPTVTLGERGATSTFRACSAATPGCVGALKLTAAAAAAPTTPIATYATELIMSPQIGSIEHCAGPGNTLYLEGDGFMYPGALTIFDAAFTVTGGDQRTAVTIAPANAIQGTPWTFEISTVQLGQPLAVGAYRDTRQTSSPGHAQLQVKGDTPWAYCVSSYIGEFQVHSYAYSTKLDAITVSFRQWCNPAKVLSGCLRIE